MARFGTEAYQKVSSKNVNNQYMHLTNYAINKTHYNYRLNSVVNNKECGHKRSYESVLKQFSEEGKDVNLLQKRINHLIVSSVCAVQPLLNHAYRSSQPSDLKRDMCFQVLGFDVMIDINLNPWLLEVNHSPSTIHVIRFQH